MNLPLIIIIAFSSYQSITASNRKKNIEASNWSAVAFGVAAGSIVYTLIIKPLLEL
ncbi:hypothetical protein Peternella1_19 [Winogradskyella phage Peternella_1]|uniref:Uncharacterized protein n=1 Tax=Winogradskyella phage Peternella_1 TaxID=2745699 RepID=A0A8E5E9V8_9CAUD|nr:hypothetical protein M1M32_gp19 [Winogradskyella phage Peternella_1]QQV91555.1 hypothetical protein Peternella1_19 [Winogradskyella phage Peternella_1]